MVVTRITVWSSLRSSLWSSRDLTAWPSLWLSRGHCMVTTVAITDFSAWSSLWLSRGHCRVATVVVTWSLCGHHCGCQVVTVWSSLWSSLSGDVLMRIAPPMGHEGGGGRCRVTASGLPDDVKDSVREIVAELGGRYSESMSRSATHLVVQYQQGEKYKHAASYGVIPVTLAWLINCAKEGQCGARPFTPPSLCFSSLASCCRGRLLFSLVKSSFFGMGLNRTQSNTFSMAYFTFCLQPIFQTLFQVQIKAIANQLSRFKLQTFVGRSVPFLIVDARTQLQTGLSKW